MYMDRTYVPKEKLEPVYERGMKLWMLQVLKNSKIKERMIKQALDSIHRERMGEDIDRNAIRKLTQMYMEISKEAYIGDFESRLLSSTRTFFQTSSQEFLSTNSVPDYLKKAQMWIDDEKKRADSYMDPSSKSKLLEVVYDEVLTVHLQHLVDPAGCDAMLQDEKWPDLGRMYKMFTYIKAVGLPKLCEVLKDYIDREGMAFIKDPAKTGDAVVYIEGLLALKNKYANLVDEHFHKDKKFTQAFNAAFEHFINENNRSPEFLSLYVDHQMRKGLKGVTDEEADQLLDHALSFFRFMQEKDMFEKYYKQHLARRLLGGKRADDDHEGTFLAKLKAECGVHFIAKMEGMFNDTRQTDEMMEAFREEVGESCSGIDLTVNVLTTGSWPISASPNIVLPRQVMEACKVFEEFYFRRHSGRKLTWQLSMGSADIKAYFPKKRYTINVPTYMVAILMLFNETPTLSYQQIRDATQIEQKELDRQLATLVQGKAKLLHRNGGVAVSKGSGGKEKFEDGDEFRVNEKFTNSHTKVKIQVSKTTSGERDPGQSRQVFLEDRKHEIDAAVVRIMKARRMVHHNTLVTEVISSLTNRFKPDPRDIKKRVEYLIEREFLERGDDNKTYTYVP